MKINVIFHRQIFIIMMMCMLSACGFHLRGQISLPPELRILYLQTSDPYGALTVQLRQTLTSLGIKLTATPKEAPLTLIIVSEQIDKQATSFSPSTQLQTYMLIDKVIYEIHDRAGKIIIPTRMVRASRNFTSSPNQATSNLYEQNLLTQDMHRDVVSQILNQLNAKGVLRALRYENTP